MQRVRRERSGASVRCVHLRVQRADGGLPVATEHRSDIAATLAVRTPPGPLSPSQGEGVTGHEGSALHLIRRPAVTAS